MRIMLRVDGRGDLDPGELLCWSFRIRAMAPHGAHRAHAFAVTPVRSTGYSNCVSACAGLLLARGAVPVASPCCAGVPTA